ncbi:hypothetical protein GW17_00022037 [Ensete ventricosum]|nr:hypothetical protein GW17_00022037 [Ensete ventricosum]
MCCTFYVPRLRCHLSLVLSAYTWTPEDSSLAAEGCASSSGCQLVDREHRRSSRAGVDFWSLVELQPLRVRCDVPRGVAHLCASFRSSVGSPIVDAYAKAAVGGVRCCPDLAPSDSQVN